MTSKPASFEGQRSWSDDERAEAFERHFSQGGGRVADKLAAFPRFVDRSSLSRFLVKYELFKLASSINGSVVECGVHFGGGLFTFAQLSAILEPTNHRRQIIGFDTFAGFPSIHPVDNATKSDQTFVGNLAGAGSEEILDSISLFDADRPLGHLEKVRVVKGDFLKTGPAFVETNPHLLISLLYLDFDLYEPTKLALELFLPRIPAGGVIAFDQLQSPDYPGETQAVLDTLDLSKLELRRAPRSSISWIVMRADEPSSPT